MDAGLQPALWRDMFVAFATVCAALLGLFFVAISLQIRELERHPIELNRALQGLHVLLFGLVIALLVLIPRQPTSVLGTELIVAQLAYALLTLPSGIRRISRVHVPPIVKITAVVGIALMGLVIAAGVSLILDFGPGLYLVLPGVFGIVLGASLFAQTVLFVRRHGQNGGGTHDASSSKAQTGAKTSTSFTRDSATSRRPRR